MRKNGFHQSHQARILFFCCCLAATLAACAQKPSRVSIVRLKCENRERLLGADTKSPVFSWELESPERNQAQTAYQIQIAGDPGLLEVGAPDVWDSGREKSSRNLFVRYGGRELKPGAEYFWRVRVWNGRGRPTDWSTSASFVTELEGSDDWSGAQWIAYEELPDSLKLVPGVHGSGDHLGELAKRRPVVPLFRREFEVRGEVERALLFVTGLGQYELHLNGKTLGTSFLAPGWTNYRKSCLYDIYDITPQLSPSRNAVGLIVGNGFFNVNRERYRKLVIAYGMPKIILKLEIEYASGERDVVVSGPDWKTAGSPITFSSIYGGEDYDARLEITGWDRPSFDDSSWKTARTVKGPGGLLRPEKDYPLRVMEEFSAQKIGEVKPGIWVYDFGQNASGIIRLKVKGRQGQSVRISPGELLGKDGQVSQKASGEPYYWSYIIKSGGEEEWSPRFTYYGFRYAQVEGAAPAGSAKEGDSPQVIDLRLLHTRNSSPAAGSFECSNGLFNRIYNLINWAIKSNLASVPTDCPHREKLGWLEQTHLMGGSIQYNFEILNLYNKLVDDIIQAQLENGLVPDIAPEYVPFEAGFRDSPEWGSAGVILPWLICKWYGDQSAMERAYPMMTKYAAYLGTKAPHHLLSYGLGDWCDLGPGPPGTSQLTPLGLTATAVYYQDLVLLRQMAALLGHAQDAESYQRLAAEVKTAFNQEYFHNNTKSYGTGSQTSLAMPLSLGLVENKYRREVFNSLVNSIRAGNNALTAGDVGFHYLVKALEEGGASELIYEMNNRSDVPGYGYQLAKGATALTESWPAREDVSNNHLMLGHLMEWFFSGLAGIRQSEDSVGYQKIVIAPHPVGDITWAKAKHHSLYGDILCFWKIEGKKLRLEVEIPVNTRAQVFLPAAPGAEVTEGGRPVSVLKEIRISDGEGSRKILEIGSGRYHFETTR
jgi:hypothetical protein